MSKNKERTPKPGLPVMQSRSVEIDIIVKLFAAYGVISQLSVDMRKRLELIPHALSGVRMMEGRLEQLLYDLCATLPESKRNKVFSMGDYVQYKPVYNIRAAKDDNEIIMTAEDADILNKYASEWCKMCIDGNCNTCELGKVFDRTLTYNRKRDESWSNWNGWNNFK